MMKNYLKRICSVVLCCVIVFFVAVPTFVEAISTVNVGDSVKFGSYYQTLNKYGEFKKEPIEWDVLKVENGKALLLSSKIIDAARYNNTSATVDGYYGNNYAHSEVRNWLINDFYNDAFDLNEKKCILETNLDNSAAPTDVCSKGSYTEYSSENTVDKVFLLSKGEIESLARNYMDKSPTDYAKKNGFQQIVSTQICNAWLTRTAGNNTYQIYFTQIRWGSWMPYYNWYDDKITVKMGACPAIWVDIDMLVKYINSSSTISGTLDGYTLITYLDEANNDFGLELKIDGKQYKVKKDTLNYVEAESYKGQKVTAKLIGGEIYSILPDIEKKEVETSWSESQVVSDNYGAKNYIQTSESNIYQYAKEFKQAINNYLKTIKNESYKETEPDVSDIINDLRSGDKAIIDYYPRVSSSGSKLFEDPPSEDVYYAAYYGLAEFITKVVEKNNIDLNINPNDTENKQAIQIIKQLSDKFSHQIFECKYNGYKIKVDANLASTVFYGSINVCKYKGITLETEEEFYIVSGEESTRNAIAAYVNNLGTIVEKECRYALNSVFKDIKNVTGLSKVEYDWINEKCSGVVDDVFIKKGFGNEVAKTLVNMKSGYSAVKNLLSSVNILNSNGYSKYLEVAENSISMYNEIKSLDFSELGIKNQAVKTAVSVVNSAKVKLQNELWNYIYHSNINTLLSENSRENVKNCADKNTVVLQCPVEFDVYDSNNNLIGYVDSSSAHDDYVNFSNDIYIEVNGDVKYLYYPSNAEVTLRFKATDNGFMNYYIERTENGEKTGKLEYFNVPLTPGEVYEQTITANCNFKEDNCPLKLLGTDIVENGVYYAAEKEFFVTVDCLSSVNGWAVGDGEYPLGSCVEMIASPYDGCEFIGWFNGNSCVSTDEVYRFTAVDNVKLIALFDEPHNYKRDVESEPTCVDCGVAKYTCECGKTYYELISPIEHKFISVVTEPTCSTKGIKTFTCSVCGYKYTEEINKLNHTDSNSDAFCDTCGENLEAQQASCKHLCHKGGFIGFIWKILNIINRLFQINRSCNCGINHW